MMNLPQLLTIGSDLFVVLFIGQMWRMFNTLVAKVQKAEDKIEQLEKTVDAVTEIKIRTNS